METIVLETVLSPEDNSSDVYYQHQAGYSLVSVGAIGFVFNLLVLLYLYNLTVEYVLEKLRYHQKMF